MTFSMRSVTIAVFGPVVGAACHTVKENPNQAPLRNPLSLTGAGGVTPGASPTPAPNPTPTPAPQPTPTPTPTQSGGPVAKVTIGVTFIVCNDEGVPGSENARVVP